MPTWFWRLSKWMFFFLLLLFVIGVGAQIFVPNVPRSVHQVGCDWTNALIPYIHCPGVPGGRVIAFVLNLPYWVFLWAPGFFFTIVFFEDGLVDGLLSHPGQTLRMLGILLLYMVPLVLGGLYPIRWLYLKIKARLPATHEPRSGPP